MLKTIHSAILVIAIIFVAGCSTKVSEALEQANAASNPEDAWQILHKAIADHRDSHRLSDPPEALETAARAYFIAAARSGSGRALRELFSYPNDHALQAELKVSVLDTAKTSNDPNLLMAAAFIYGSDRLGLINSAQQLAAFERAWNAGGKQAAGYLAHLFLWREDFERAYYWSLRCTPPCDRGSTVGINRNGQDAYIGEVDLSKLEKHLSRSAIAKYQEEAQQTCSQDNTDRRR